MTTTAVRALLVIAALAVVVPTTSQVALPGQTEVASASWSAPDDLAGGGAPQVPRQQQNDQADEEDRVPVQVWTVVAAAGAVLLGLLGFLLRLILGRVPPPPSEEDRAHH